MSGLICGSLGASRLSDAIAKTKTGWGASRANIMAELMVERLTGLPCETYVSEAMKRGLEMEPHARSAYEFYSDAAVALTKPVIHPTIPHAHASPDGLVNDDGLVEIKCPNTATHIDTMLSEEIETKYVTQMQWQMACTGRAWCDFVSFDPRLPESMRLFVKRVDRDNGRIADLENLVRGFLLELDLKASALLAKYNPSEKAA